MNQKNNLENIESFWFDVLDQDIKNLIRSGIVWQKTHTPESFKDVCYRIQRVNLTVGHLKKELRC